MNAVWTAIAVLLTGAPEIAEVVPAPLPLTSTAEVRGTGFVADGTTLTIAGVEQSVVASMDSSVIFLVNAITPLGAQELVVTTVEGTDSAAVEVAPPAPKIDSVEPSEPFLGGLVTVLGENFDDNSSITIGGLECEVTEQTAYVIVAVVPFDAELIGVNQLVVSGGSGRAVWNNVSIRPPTPAIDVIAPNPARVGDLVTLRGQILPYQVGAKIGLVDAPLVSVGEAGVTVFIPDTVTVGPHDVTVSVGSLSSAPEGPLYVNQADPERPVIAGIYPVDVAHGGRFWVIGKHLDAIERATHGLEVVACDKKACRLDTAGASVTGAPITAAVDGGAGAGIFKVNIFSADDIEADEVVPVIDEVAPHPLFRGSEVTITGTNFHQTKAVVIGGRTQTIKFFDATSILIEVHGETPLGAETLFVAGSAGSEPFTVNVLDPFPDAPSGADAGTGGDTGDGQGGGQGGGCAGGGDAPWPWALGLLALVWGRGFLRRRTIC